MRIWSHLLLVLLLSGCSRSSDIREYDVAPEQVEILTSDILRDQFEAIPFQWDVPDSWKVAENDQFSVYAWTAGEGETAARITVSDLPASAGLEPQFLRWRGQLRLPDIDPAEVLKGVETLEMGKLTGKYAEIKGESETIFGMVVPVKQKLWVFKYRSVNATADQQREAFRKFCESLKIQ